MSSPVSFTISHDEYKRLIEDFKVAVAARRMTAFIKDFDSIYAAMMKDRLSFSRMVFRCITFRNPIMTDEEVKEKVIKAVIDAEWYSPAQMYNTETWQLIRDTGDTNVLGVIIDGELMSTVNNAIRYTADEGFTLQELKNSIKERVGGQHDEVIHQLLSRCSYLDLSKVTG
jgi:hypothetical protein